METEKRPVTRRKVTKVIKTGQKVSLVEDKAPEIPKDLSEKWGAVEATATTFNLMQKGTFTASYMTVLNASLSFLQKLHEQTVEDALKHPKADLIPELKAIKEEREKNGKSKEQ
jgi:uncharacterized protein YdeI (YjbR/CyaY-like superfamily)